MAVLERVQVFDQEIAARRRVAEQGRDLGARGGLDLPAFGVGPRLAPPGARVAVAADLVGAVGHGG